jgi:diguanylate cyclase (GGDEF)-like protein
MYFVFVATVMPMISRLASELNKMRTNLKTQKRELQVAFERIQELATRDELTGLYNRRQITQVLGEHAARSDRGVVNFWVAVLDLDHFKRINDSHGHGVGDEVLRSFAKLAAEGLRDTDVIGRWGGEEFLVVMLAVPPHDPHSGLERLRVQLQHTQVSQSQPELRVSFSAGLAAYTERSAVQEAIERADRALYQAKAQGRNCTVLAPDHA